MFRVVLSLVAVAVAALAGSVCAQSYGMAPKPGEPGPEVTGNAKYEPKEGAVIPVGLTFYDHEKRPIMIQELMGGKPTILVMAYFSCPKLCNLVGQGLLTALRSDSLIRNGFSAGNQFNVIVVSIDPREPPEQARQRREQFLQAYDGRSVEQTGVWFLTANRGQGTVITEAEANVKALADAVGFNYVYDKKIKQYIHDSGILILAPDGRISRFFPGIDYSGQDIRLAVVEAGEGKVGTISDHVVMLCFAYDQASGHYKFTMRALALVSVPFVFLVIGLAVYTGRRVYKERAATRFGPVPPTTGGL